MVQRRLFISDPSSFDSNPHIGVCPHGNRQRPPRMFPTVTRGYRWGKPPSACAGLDDLGAWRDRGCFAQRANLVLAKNWLVARWASTTYSLRTCSAQDVGRLDPRMRLRPFDNRCRFNDHLPLVGNEGRYYLLPAQLLDLPAAIGGPLEQAGTHPEATNL